MKAGWETKILGDVCERVTVGHVGITAPYYRNDGILFLRTQNVGKAGLLLDDRKYVTPEFHASLKKSEVKAGDVLMSRVITHTVNCALIPTDLGPANCANVVLVRPVNQKLDARFLIYYINSCEGQRHLLDRKVGSAQLVVNTNVIKSWPIPVPPLSEQQRIVGILDEAFEGIATAKVNAGKNLQNARALFESHLYEVFSQRGEGWERVMLETLLERGWILSHLDGNHGGDYPRKEEFIGEGVPYISANCIDDDQVDMSCAKYLAPERAALLRKGIARDRDVLFAHNATVGPVAILRTEEEKVILSTSLTYYRCNEDYILPEYLAHYMRSLGFKSQYEQIMRQSTRNQVPITKQREFYHVIPPIHEQVELVKQLDGLFENGRCLESIYQQKLAALDALKKSLLNQAFSGNL
jgi:type I restriction enzyme S subunit